MFPQLGPSDRLSGGQRLVPDLAMPQRRAVRSWGWRIPFLLSAALVMVGLYVRLKLHETPVFAKAVARQEPVKVPLVELFASLAADPAGRCVDGGVLCAVYITTVFSLSYGVSTLGYSAKRSWACCALPCCSWAWRRRCRPGQRSLRAQAGADRRRGAGDPVGLSMEPLLTHGSTWGVALFLAIELFLMGVTLPPMARAAAGTVPDPRALYRCFGGL
jgi:hypothetical protein